MIMANTWMAVSLKKRCRMPDIDSSSRSTGEAGRPIELRLKKDRTPQHHQKLSAFAKLA